MSTNATHPDSSVGRTVERLADAVEDLTARMDIVEDRLDDLEDEHDEQDDAEDVKQDEGDADEVEQLSVRVDALSTGLSTAHDVIENLESRFDGREPMSDAEDTAPDARQTPETPLEQTVALPEEMIAEETANVQRAVFVARNAKDYTTKVPAGRAIRSSELRRVLKAGTDTSGHSQTVDRVIEILDDLGGDDMEVVERRIVFSEEIVARLAHLTTDEQDSHDVVTEARA